MASGNDFLRASSAAADDLEQARKQHKRQRDRADQRLTAAKQRHRAEVETAGDVEAAAWARLADVPGMTVGMAARIGDVSEPTASRWIARGRAQQAA